MNRRLLCLAALIAGAAVLAAISNSVAQTPAAGEKPAAAAEDRRGPLPINYGKLGLSDEQKEKLYALQDEYDKKLEPIREQLKSLVRERDQKMEGNLTEGQKLRLKELRAEARKKMPENAEAAPAPPAAK